MKLNKNYAGISFLYRKNGAVSTVMEIVMKEAVNGKMLQAAVNFTVSRHPYFKSSLQERKGDYYIAENEMPFVVKETTKLFPLGSKELNYHLIDVTYYGKQIFVSFHHALCDGLGARRFVETLVCYYSELYYRTSIESGDGTLPKAGDILDPFAGDFYSVEDKPMPKSIRDGYVLPEIPEVLEDDTNYRYAFTLDNDSLMAYGKKIGASPAIVIGILMSQAIHNVHPDGDKPIICNMASSIREGLNAENTLKNCVNTINIPYDPNLEMEEQVKEYKRIIAEHKDKNYMKQCANNMIGMFRKIEKLETLEEKKNALSIMDTMRINTFSLSYTGRLDLIECEKYIESTHLYSGGNNSMLVNMMSIGTTTTVDVIQCFKDEDYVKVFKELLKQAGIEFKVSEQITFTTPRDGIAETPAVESVRKQSYVDFFED